MIEIDRRPPMPFQVDHYLTDCIGFESGENPFREDDGETHYVYDLIYPSAARLRELALMNYLEYLTQPEWQFRRDVALWLADDRCEICDGTDVLQVHHRHYAARGTEPFSDLTVLCSGCHSHYHLDPPDPFRRAS